tara:strand:- start:66 stop:323 length:258 start_codon:yes stop_codon:yes gene_type:complete
MKKIPLEHKMIISYLSFLIFILYLASIMGCSNGWSVGNLELTPSDTSSAIQVVFDQNGNRHWYYKVIHGDNWCFFHDQYEKLEIK